MCRNSSNEKSSATKTSPYAVFIVMIMVMLLISMISENWPKKEKNEELVTTQSAYAEGTHDYPIMQALAADNSSDTILLAQLIEAEAGSASSVTRYRVGITALNRITSAYFPDSLYSVMYQENQYETVRDGYLPEYPTQENLEIAQELLEQFYSTNWEAFCVSYKLSDKVVFQANDSVDQSWYSYSKLDEYGHLFSGDYFHMVYGEALEDFSPYPHEEDYY